MSMSEPLDPNKNIIKAIESLSKALESQTPWVKYHFLSDAIVYCKDAKFNIEVNGINSEVRGKLGGVLRLND